MQDNGGGDEGIHRTSTTMNNNMDQALKNETRQLMKCLLGECTGLLRPRWVESKALSTMKRVVNKVLERHRYTYIGMINKLSLDGNGGEMRFISAVASKLFADGITNWGRVVSLTALGAAACQHLKAEKDSENCVELLAEELSSYLLTYQRDWLVENNSWDGFVEFFQEAHPESTLRNILMTVVVFAGIGATLTLLIK